MLGPEFRVDLLPVLQDRLLDGPDGCRYAVAPWHSIRLFPEPLLSSGSPDLLPVCSPINSAGVRLRMPG